MNNDYLKLLPSITLLLSANAFAVGAPVSHQFQGGQPASASQVNENFQELADRIADLPNATSYDYRSYLSTVSSKSFSISGNVVTCGDTETWTYTRTPNGVNTDIAITMAGTLNDTPCRRIIGYYTASPQRYERTGYDSLNPDTLDVNTSYRYQPAIVNALTPMVPGHQFSQHYELFQTPRIGPDTGIETSRGLSLTDMTVITLEDVSVPAGNFNACLKIRRNTFSGSNIHRSIVWRCPVIGQVKSIAFNVIHYLNVNETAEDRYTISELASYTP